MTLYLRAVLPYSLYIAAITILIVLFTLPTTLVILSGYLVLCAGTALVNYRSVSRNLRRVVQRGRGGYLYAFSDVGQLIPVVKIGRESERGARLLSHRTAAPFGLYIWFSFYVPDAVAAESYLHRRYAVQRYNPRAEWFILTPVMLFELKYLGWFKR